MISSILEHPVRKIKRLQAQQAQQMADLLAELESDKTNKLVSDENFLRSPNVNASEEEISFHLQQTKDLYDTALKFVNL